MNLLANAVNLEREAHFALTPQISHCRIGDGKTASGRKLQLRVLGGAI